MAFFKLSPAQEEEQASSALDELEESKRPRSDAALAVKGGFEDIGQLVSGAIEYGGRKLDLPRVEEWARSEIKRSKSVNKEIDAAMSERGRKAMKAPLFATKEGEQTMMDDPGSSIGLKSARMVPMILASAIPGTIMARLGLGAVGAAVGTGATGAALGTGDVVNAISDEIDNISHEDLLKQSKVYRTEIENGVDPIEARQTIKNIAQDEAVPLTALINFATNAFGPEALAARFLGGATHVGKGFLRGGAEGLATGAVTEAIEGGATAYQTEKAGEEYGGQEFSWMDIAKQAAEEGFMGGLFGGGIGGVTNIKGRSKAGGPKAQPKAQIEAVATGTPNAAETAALKPKAQQPPAAAQPSPGAGAPPDATPIGPPTVQQPGTETPPPGAKIEKTRRNYKKPTVAAGKETLAPVTPTGPDPAQTAALQGSKPLVRKRAQAEQAVPAVVSPPAPQAGPPVQAPPEPQITQPSVPPAQVAPPAPPVVEQPPVPTPPIVLGKVAPTGRVLPDLQAQAREQADFERRAQKPDDVAGRGRRYQQTEASVDNNAEHQAWRRKMFREAKGENPSPIAVEATKIRAQPGIDLPEPAKERLRQLHRDWLKAQNLEPVQETPAERPRGQRGKLALPGGLVVKDAKRFVLEAARAAREEAGDAKARVEAFGEILRSAPNREDVNQELRSHPFVQQAAVFKEKLDKGTATEEDIKSFEKAEGDFVALSQEELDAQTRDIEAGIANKGGTGAVEIAAELPTEEEASTLKEAEEVETKASKTPIVEPGTFGAASDVRRPTLSDDEKAALIAKYNQKEKSAKAPEPAPAPKGGETKVREPAKSSGKVGLPKEVKHPKAEAVKKPKKDKDLSKKEIIDRIGRSILDIRTDAQTALNDGNQEAAAELRKQADAIEKRLLDNFGPEEHARVTKTIEAALNIEVHAVGSKTPFENLVGTADRRNLNPKLAIGYDKDGKKIPPVFTVHSTTVGEVLSNVDKRQMALDWNLFGEGLNQISNLGVEYIIPRIVERANNVPIHIVKDSDWNTKFNMAFASGVYFSDHKIFMPESMWFGNPTERTRVVLHEAAHAAFVNIVNRDAATRADLQELLDYVKKVINSLGDTDQDLRDRHFMAYSLKNIHELVAEAFSHPVVQATLSTIELPPAMAKKFNIPEFKKKSAWAGFIAMVRRAIGLPQKAHTALEAVIHIPTTLAAIRRSEPRKSSAPDLDDPFVRDWLKYNQNKDDPKAYYAQSLMQDELTNRMPKAGIRSWTLNLATLHQLAQMADRYFPKGLSVKISDIVERQRLRRADLIAKASDRVVTNLHQLQKKYAGTGEFAAMERIADRATSADIHPDVPLSNRRNGHIKKGAKYRFARQEHAELYKEWQKLPADLKQAWHDARTYLTEAQNDIAYLSLSNIIEQVLERKDEQLTKRIFNGTIDENDRELFRTNNAMRQINNARELKRIKGVYFPKMRRGDYVVTGKYKLPQWDKYKAMEKGQPVEDGIYEFHDEADYNKFIDDMRQRGITVTNVSTWTAEDVTNKRYYTYTDPVTGVVNKDKGGLPRQYRFERGDTDTHQVYRTTIQDKLMEMHDSERAAKQAYNDLKADGNYDVDGPVMHRDLNVHTSKATSRQIRAAVGAMEQSGGWKNMSEAQKNATKQAFLELSLSFVASTAPQNRARPRRNVLGASKDLVRNVAEYSAASAGSISSLEHQPELEKAFKELHDYEKNFRQQTPDITLPRSQLLNKMEEMAYADDGSAPTKRNRLINALLAISFMDKLVSPAYHMINMLQPWMVSAPVLGGRHGFSKATYELGRAYNSMGFASTLASGAKDTKRAMFDLLEGTTDYMGDARKRLSKQKDGAELADMLDYLHNRGLIDKDAGLEVAELINAGNKAERLLHRVDHVVRQFGTAVEVVNRMTTAIAAYRMERAKGASVDDARVYAQEMVANTQGNYSMTNAPKLFRHPLGRIALQFKKFAQLQYFLLSKLTYNTFKGATREEKIEAAKSLAALLTAHVAMAGAVGLPTEPIKIPWMILSMFLPIPSWDEIEQGATDYAQSFLGDNLGDAVTHGLPRLVGVDLSSRVGLNSLVLFGEPRGDKENDVKAWVFDTLAGAPIGLGVDWVKGAQALADGEFGAAAEKLIPFKVMSDSVKAYRRATEGKINNRGEQVADPWGLGNAALQALGFKPASEARQQESTAAFYAQSGRRKAERQELLDEFVTSSDRAAVRKKIFKFNARVPKDARITMSSLSQLLKRKRSDKKKGYVRDGVYGGKLNKDLLDKYIGE